jgi:steroid delta-isomerase-like uncharacterized protein
MSEQNKAAVHRVIEEVWSRGNFAVVDELVAHDYVGHSSGTERHGREGYTEYFATLRQAFPDLQFTVEDQIAEGDRVATRWTARGTHEGAYAGIPPTHRRGVVAGTTVYRIAQGQIRECWTHLDELGLLQQLGVIPALAPAR